MLAANNLAVSFGVRQVLSHVSFTIGDGEKVGLVGENGAGKTTLMRVVASEISPAEGSISLSKSTRDHVCYVPQHLSLRGMNDRLNVLEFMRQARGLNAVVREIGEIEDKLRTGINDEQSLAKAMSRYADLQNQFNDLEGFRADDDILNLLTGLGLTSIDLDQPVRTLSGGYKTKLVLARMLFERSAALFLDEPTNHLDEDSVVWLADYLSKTDQSVLVISHLPEFLDKVVTRILHLDKQTGRLKSYPGNYSAFCQIKAHNMLTDNRKQTKVTGEIARQQEIINRLPQRDAAKKKSRQKTVARLRQELPVEQTKVQTVKISFPVKTKMFTQALEVVELAKSFGSRRVLRSLSFALGPTEKIGIIGENGAGKTTLTRIITGDLEADRGKISLNPKAEIGWYRQEQEGLDDYLTVLQEVCQTGLTSMQIIRRTLAHFLFFESQLNQSAATLSRGERARLALCKMILLGPNLLLLDEPTNHLDQPSCQSLVAALAKYEAAAIIVSHDLQFLKAIGVNWCLRLPEERLVRLD